MTDTLKVQPKDSFKNTIVPSQYFDIDGRKDTVLEAENGTMVVCPIRMVIVKLKWLVISH